jgi:hypothetical protein
MYKMIKDEIEEDKIDIETSVPLPTYNCTEELNERLDIFIIFILIFFSTDTDKLKYSVM